MRRFLVLCLLLAGCSWSNALYNARRLSKSAAKAERQQRSFDAGSLWGQVAVKAESAYVRDPDGDHAPEALWLRGQALAHLGDCVTADTVLEHARSAEPRAAWSDDLRLELGRCRAKRGDPEGAVGILRPLFGSDREPLRAEAMQVAGRALVQSGHWDEALKMLAADEDPDAIWDRALALAHLGRFGEAIAAIEPRIQLSDSTANWDALVRTVATETPDSVDGLLARLDRMRFANDTTRAAWRLAAAQGLEASGGGDPERYFGAILRTPRVPAANRARTELIDRRFAALSDSVSLQRIIDSLPTLTRGDLAATAYAAQKLRWARAIRGDLATDGPGAAEGDLAMLFDASIARDTLDAVRLASWLLQRLERGWPRSPYLAKGLLIRLRLDPDSAPAIRQRLAALSGSPYLAYLAGRSGSRFTALEDSLRFYIDDRSAGVIAATDPDAN